MQHLLSSATGLLHYLTTMRQLIDADAREIKVQTESYTLEGKEAIDRLSVDLRAGRLIRFKLFDSVVGNRDIEVNYHGN
ncbi:hypothetical protein [Pararobbsia alpina]|uniref:Uncharacterized protein n=1 Tax=Pararobbsia alpina TaxID=621374 RepID=A0A6S7B9F7_9BURK|nr:hypothetical protein [Pararobbsia alpina]CAB3791579.1 hypothetical protein LMG28138_03189 [Pararobbsia alpina]